MSVTHITLATGGRQYRVKAGDAIVVNRLSAAVGDTVRLEDVLLQERADGSIRAGKDAAMAVSATVAEHFRGEKLRVFKMRRRKSSRRTAGHRQDLTRLVIGDFAGGDA